LYSTKTEIIEVKTATYITNSFIYKTSIVDNLDV
jgi:hypothetical protein